LLASNAGCRPDLRLHARAGHLAAARAGHRLERVARRGRRLLFGVVQLADIAVVWGIVWNATATFIAVILISLLLDEAGFFEWAALHVARWGNGRGRRLFAFIVLLGAAVSALFANDGAALILTPIVMAMLARARLHARGHARLRDGRRLHRRHGQPAARGVEPGEHRLGRFLRDRLQRLCVGHGSREHRRGARQPRGADAVFPPRHSRALRRGAARGAGRCGPRPATFRAGWVVLVLLLVGFFGLEPLGVPVSAVAAFGRVVLLAVAARGHVISTRKVLRGAPWQIVVFSLGMYLVVYGLRNAGLTGRIASLLDVFAQGGVWGAAWAPAFSRQRCRRS
jgi:arsenical pump membrane protein